MVRGGVKMLYTQIASGRISVLSILKAFYQRPYLSIDNTNPVAMAESWFRDAE